MSHLGRRIGLSTLACLALLAVGCTSFERPRVESVTITPSTLNSRSRATAEVAITDVQARGTTLEYQWLRNGERIPGAIEASLDLSVAGHGDRGDRIAVRVVASRRFASSGSATSAEAQVEPVATVVMQQSTEYYSVEGTDSESVFASIRKNELNEGTSSRVRLGQTRFSLTKSW